MSPRYKKIIGILALVLVMVYLSASVTADSNTRTYRVTIRNLTNAQAFTPPVAAIHRQPVDLFEVGKPASFEVKEIAENGNVTPLFDKLSSQKDVIGAIIGLADDQPPPVLPGAERTFDLTVDKNAKFFSFVSMLICTNDGFTGVDAARLPKKVGDRVSGATNGYDAGTEINTEDFADLVPPCSALSGVPSSEPGTGESNPALAENGVIQHHPGIQGEADLSVDIHGWADPVAEYEITRID
jgi:hypothetical protein